MIDRTVLEKMAQDSRWDGESGFLAAVNKLPPKIGGALKGIVVASANELCFTYDDLFNYVTTAESEKLCLSVARGLENIDYSLLPQSKHS